MYHYLGCRHRIMIAGGQWKNMREIQQNTTREGDRKEKDLRWKFWFFC